MVFSWLDNCKFTAVSAGTVDFVYSAAVTGYQGPAAAAAVNTANYSYFAISQDLTQWELGQSLSYNSGTTTFPRSTVLYNSAGTGLKQGGSGSNKINFTLAPNVAIIATAEDVSNLGGTATVAYRYNASAGQTTFTGLDLNSLTLLYVAGSVLVFVNGELQTPTADYTATNGTSVVFGSGLSLGDEVIIVALSANAVTSFNTAAQYQFNATSGQTVFTGADANGNTLACNGFFTMVHKNGRLLSPTADYTLTSTTMTLVAGANVSDTIEIVSINTNNLTGATQAALDNSTNMATTAYVDRLYTSASNLGLNATQKQNALAQLGISAGHVPGIATNVAAAAGEVGEVISSGAVTTGTLTSGTTVAAASITLTPGDWDISAVVEFNTAGATSVTDWYSSVSTTSAVVTTPITGSLILHERVAAMNDHASHHTHAPAQALVSTNTAYFINIQGVYTGTAPTATVIIRARRAR